MAVVDESSISFYQYLNKCFEQYAQAHYSLADDIIIKMRRKYPNSELVILLGFMLRDEQGVRGWKAEERTERYKMLCSNSLVLSQMLTVATRKYGASYNVDPLPDDVILHILKFVHRSDDEFAKKLPSFVIFRETERGTRTFLLTRGLQDHHYKKAAEELQFLLRSAKVCKLWQRLVPPASYFVEVLGIMPKIFKWMKILFQYTIEDDEEYTSSRVEKITLVNPDRDTHHIFTPPVFHYEDDFVEDEFYLSVVPSLQKILPFLSKGRLSSKTIDGSIVISLSNFGYKLKMYIMSENDIVREQVFCREDHLFYSVSYYKKMMYAFRKIIVPYSIDHHHHITKPIIENEPTLVRGVEGNAPF